MKKILQTTIVCLSLFKICISQTNFTGKPQYNILTIQNGDTIGVTTVELFPNIAPLHVANFDSLVNVHFFDSTAFHRVIPGFMIQGGDPNSRHGPDSTWGMGNLSQANVNAEFSAARHLRGTLSAARDADTNSANSQFFICVATCSWLNGDYTVYGRVVAGMNYVDTIVNTPRDTNDNPLSKIEMFISYAGSNDVIPVSPVLNLPISGSSANGGSKTLKWLTQPDAILYNLEIATDSLFNNIYRNVKVATNSYTVSGLAGFTKYYWRVRTNNGGHYSPYSTVWNFSTLVVGLQETGISNVDISPNPSNGVFKFDHIINGKQIEIVDVEGQDIYRSKIDGQTLMINLNDFDAGIYFYTLTYINGEKETGKLLKD